MARPLDAMMAEQSACSGEIDPQVAMFLGARRRRR